MVIEVVTGPERALAFLALAIAAFKSRAPYGSGEFTAGHWKIAGAVKAKAMQAQTPTIVKAAGQLIIYAPTLAFSCFCVVPIISDITFRTASLLAWKSALPMALSDWDLAV